MLKSRFNLSVRQTALSLYLVTLVYCGAGIVVAMVPETTGWFVFGGVFIAKIIFLHFLGYSKLIFPLRGYKTLAALLRFDRVNGSRVNGNGKLNGSHVPVTQQSSAPLARPSTKFKE